MSTAPITDEEISFMNLPKEYSERLVVDEGNPQIASIILSCDNSGNPDKDEVSIFCEIIDDYGNASVFFGYPKEDMSNALTEDASAELWDMLNACEVDFYEK